MEIRRVCILYSFEKETKRRAKVFLGKYLKFLDYIDIK
jgi:hypothetical protein